MFRIEIELQGLDVLDEKRFQKAVAEARDCFIKKYKEVVTSHFSEDEDYPFAPPVPSPFSPVKIHFPDKKTVPRIRTGKLRSAIVFIRIRDGAKVTLDKDKVPYGDLIHDGGTVRPVKRKYLAVGIQKDTYLTPPSRYSKHLIVARGILFERLANAYRPLYLLVKQVYIPPRPFLLINKDEFSKITATVLNCFLSGLRKR